jgi:hypothetical protein
MELKLNGSSPEAARLDAMKQPLTNVRVSPHLDVLERAVIAAILHHLGALEPLTTTQNDRDDSNFAGLCHRVSVAARDVRKNVMAMRDLDNMALKEDEEPREWSAYTDPLVARCKFLLLTAPMCVSGDECSSKESFCAEASEVKQAITTVSLRARRKRKRHTHTFNIERSRRFATSLKTKKCLLMALRAG